MTAHSAHQQQPLRVALVASAALHALLLSWQLATPNSTLRTWAEERLEVVLVNAKEDRAPQKAQAKAQANLTGGGKEPGESMAESPLPPTDAMELGDATESAESRLVQRLLTQQKVLLMQARRDLALAPPPDPQLAANSTNGQTEQERVRLKMDLLAQVERRINDQQQGPRQRFVGPSTQEASLAAYHVAMSKKIEDRGTRNFPAHSGRRLYGTLTMTLKVNQSGHLIGTELIQSSGNSQLDRQAAAIVRAAGPFGSFTPDMRKEAEILLLSAQFNFDRDKGVKAVLSAQTQ